MHVQIWQAMTYIQRDSEPIDGLQLLSSTNYSEEWIEVPLPDNAYWFITRIMGPLLELVILPAVMIGCHSIMWLLMPSMLTKQLISLMT